MDQEKKMERESGLQFETQAWGCQQTRSSEPSTSITAVGNMGEVSVFHLRTQSE